MYHSFFSGPAQSIFAASSTSVGIDARPAMKMITANGSIRQAWTMMIAKIARFGWPSHCGGLFAPQPLPTSNSEQTAPTVWVSFSVQFTTLNRESKIQSQRIVTSATGAAQGRMTRKRTNHLPRKSRTRKCESTAAPMTTITWAENVMISVFSSAVRKFWSCQASVKLSSPMNLPESEPPVASVRLR